MWLLNYSEESPRSISSDENVEATTFALCDFRNLARCLLVLFTVRIEVHFSDRFYGIFERIARATESIDKTLKAPPEDFATEDETVQKALTAVNAAKERIPHGT